MLGKHIYIDLYKRFNYCFFFTFFKARLVHNQLMYIPFKTGPLLITVPFGTEKAFSMYKYFYYYYYIKGKSSEANN